LNWASILPWVIVAILVAVSGAAWARELRREAAAKRAGRRNTDLTQQERDTCATCRQLEKEAATGEKALHRHRDLHVRMATAQHQKAQAERRKA